MKPMRRSTRVDQTSRVKTSRPNWSVPSQCAPLGPWSTSVRFCVVGEYEVISGAKIATRMSAPTITIPATSEPLRYQGRSERERAGRRPAVTGGEGRGRGGGHRTASVLARSTRGSSSV